jgi:hypothetical protein
LSQAAWCPPAWCSQSDADDVRCCFLLALRMEKAAVALHYGIGHHTVWPSGVPHRASTCHRRVCLLTPRYCLTTFWLWLPSFSVALFSGLAS